jgi:hypothetical protein
MDGWMFVCVVGRWDVRMYWVFSFSCFSRKSLEGKTSPEEDCFGHRVFSVASFLWQGGEKK